jgi:hypothetical protein
VSSGGRSPFDLPTATVYKLFQRKGVTERTIGPELEKVAELPVSRRLLWLLNLGSVPLGLVAIAPLYLTVRSLHDTSPASSSSPSAWIFLTIPSLLLVHELVHYLAFMLWGGLSRQDCRFVVNWKFLTPGVAFRGPVRVADMRVVLLSPLVVTAAIFLIPALRGGNFAWVILFGVAAGAASADLCWTFMLRRFGKEHFVRVGSPGPGFDIFAPRERRERQRLMIRRLAFLALMAGFVLGGSWVASQVPLQSPKWLKAADRTAGPFDVLGLSISTIEFKAEGTAELRMAWALYHEGKELAREEHKRRLDAPEGNVTVILKNFAELSTGFARDFQIIFKHDNATYKSRLFAVPSDLLKKSTSEMSTLDGKLALQHGEEYILLRWTILPGEADASFTFDAEGTAEAIAANAFVVFCQITFSPYAPTALDEPVSP